MASIAWPSEVSGYRTVVFWQQLFCREIQPGIFASRPQNHSIPSARGLFFRLKRPEVFTFGTGPVCPPFPSTLPTNPHVFAGPSVATPVQEVFALGADTKIFTAIVEVIAVYVVHHDPLRRQPHDYTPNRNLRAGLPIWPALNPAIALHIPAIAVEQWQHVHIDTGLSAGNINNCVHSYHRGYSATWCIITATVIFSPQKPLVFRGGICE